MMNVLEDNDYFTFWEEEGIVCFTYKQKIITLDIAKMGVEIRLRVSHNAQSLMYVDMSNVKSIFREAREYYATYDAGKLLTATAVYTPSQLTKTICSFFKYFNKPDLPFSYFCNKEKAFRWLHKFEGAPVAELGNA